MTLREHLNRLVRLMWRPHRRACIGIRARTVLASLKTLDEYDDDVVDAQWVLRYRVQAHENGRRKARWRGRQFWLSKNVNGMAGVVARELSEMATALRKPMPRVVCQ